MSADMGAALLLAMGVGGAALFVSKLDTDKKIKEASKQVSNHTHDIENLTLKTYTPTGAEVRRGGQSAVEESHNHEYLLRNYALLNNITEHDTAWENVTDEYRSQIRYRELMDSGRPGNNAGRLYVGHPKGVLNKTLRSQSKSKGFVPAYRANLRTSLPAMGPGNTESDYFYDRIVEGRVISPDYDSPIYRAFQPIVETTYETGTRSYVDPFPNMNPTTYGGEWITMVDLVRALEALNGKVEEYRNAMYADMREYGHSHNNAEVLT